MVPYINYLMIQFFIAIGNHNVTNDAKALKLSRCIMDPGAHFKINNIVFGDKRFYTNEFISVALSYVYIIGSFVINCN